MNLKHLTTFLVLSETKSFTKTAEQLHYAQSNVTTQIQKLEDELNVRLFERLGKSVTLTSAGEELVISARQLLQLSDNLKKRFKKEKVNRITIGASESLCIYRLPEIIKQFQNQHPNVEIFLTVLKDTNYLPLLINNTIDIAFVLDTPIDNDILVNASSYSEEISMVCAPSFPLSKKHKLSINDFIDIPLILTEKECCYRKQFEKYLNDVSISPKVILETSSPDVIKEITMSGIGVCILPEIVVQKELENHTLVKLNYKKDYNIHAQLMHHKDKWISDILQEFITIAKRT
ncbi:LysR family transcriptional regulator [Breznakia pachnodae]|uniref:DNA-binding transcriptional LysR family regulator n=1 Tax=Breznakia pachnodae TaxID=265178 RepID=A0ABU0E3S5_9FIRM|nr:LysR family transcriptional regulator [Breznakia pachnodae]MDQ0361145.1 DNA-binding transcriptional LysR family regulator [Breznakia pachnodae]